METQSQTLSGRIISIHALREEGDEAWAAANGKTGISIHALREEGDQEHQGDPKTH